MGLSLYNKSRQIDFALRSNGATVFLKYQPEKMNCVIF